MPIREGDGTGIASVREGDGAGVAEVRTGAGDVLWTSGPSQTFLYDEGNMEGDWTEGYSDGSGSQSKETDHLLLSIPSQGQAEAERTWVTDQTIDLTDFDLLNIDWVGNHTSIGGNVNGHLIVSEDKQLDHSNRVDFISLTDGWDEITTLDVSGLSDSLYIRIHCEITGGDGLDIETYQVWLE